MLEVQMQATESIKGAALPGGSGSNHFTSWLESDPEPQPLFMCLGQPVANERGGNTRSKDGSSNTYHVDGEDDDVFHDCIDVYELEAIMSDSSSSGDTDETQWEDENLKDPWTHERVAKESDLLESNPGR